jgi:hypothetical protein
MSLLNTSINNKQFFFSEVVIFKKPALDESQFGSAPISGAGTLCPYFDDIAQFCYWNIDMWDFIQSLNWNATSEL